MIRYGMFMVLLGAGSAAQAGDKPIYAAAPDWVKPAPAPAPPPAGEAPPVVLIYDQQRRIQDGQVWAYFDGATSVTTNEVLARSGTIKMVWQPSDGDLIVHKVAILRDGASIDLLAGDSRFTVLRREAQLEALTMNGLLTATMAAEGLRVGDVLRVAYSVTTSDRALKGGVQTVLPLVAEPMRVGFARARLLWKPEVGLRYRTYLPGIAARPKDIGGYRELELALPLAKFADLPGDAPVRVRPLQLLEATSFADWAAVSSVMAPLYRTAGTVAPASPLASEIDRIAKAG